jgi:hypothetical protein
MFDLTRTKRPSSSSKTWPNAHSTGAPLRFPTAAKRTIASAAIAGTLAILGASSASAATQIGSTFLPAANCNVATWLHTGQPGGGHAVPFSGVITSWSFQAAGTASDLNFKLARPVGGDNYEIVGESGVKDVVPSMLNTFSVRISAQAGDVIGYHTKGAGNCKSFPAGYTIGFYAGIDDPPLGSVKDFGTLFGQRLDISAMLEADADCDGFGDETQDSSIDPSGCNPPQPGDSSAPNVTITESPKNKTRKRKATFAFTGTDARAVASFQCKLDAAAFAPCTSPHTVKVKTGRHTFEVQAIDAAGNVSAPATDTWKRKKKKK